MIDLIKDLKEISDKCNSYGECWEKSECPMHLSYESNPIHTRCALRLLMYKLGNNTPNYWLNCLKEIDEILEEENEHNCEKD